MTHTAASHWDTPTGRRADDGAGASPPLGLLKAALQAMSDGVVLYDLSGRVLFANAAELRICGFSGPDEMVHRLEDFASVFELRDADGELVPPADWPASRVLRGEEVSGVELSARRKDTGREWVFHFTGQLLTSDDAEPMALLVTRDITESRRAEEVLRDSEGRFRELADAMPQLVWTARDDGVVDYYNGRAVEYGGIAPAVDGTWEWRPVTHPDDLGRTLAAWNEAAASRTPYVCEHRARMADGSYRWHLSRALPVVQRDGAVKWYGTATDIHELKVAEGALRDSEAQYRSLFESVDQGFCVLGMIFDEDGRPTDYRFLEYNRVWERETGLKDAVGKTAREMVPELDDSWFEIYGEVALTGEPRRFENHAPAMERWFDVYAFRVGAPELRRVALLFSNITERRRREQNAAFLAEVAADLALPFTWDELIERVSAKLCSHLDLSRVAFAEVDEGAEEATVIFSRQRRGLRSGLGTFSLADFMTDEFVSQLKAGAVVSIDDVTKDRRTADLAGSYFAFEVGAQVHVPFLRNGRLLSLLAVYCDQPRAWRDDELELIKEMSGRLWNRRERARAEEALQDRMERYRLLGRATNDVIWDWDPASDKLEWNDAVTEQYGHSRAELGSTFDGWAKNIHPEDRQRTVERLRAAIDEGEEGWTGEYRFKKRDGSYAAVLDRGYILRDASGRALRMIGSMLDLTERKAAEMALKEAALQKDRFLAVLSHELRNPLAPIKNGVYILRRAPGSEQASRALDVIDRQTLHLTRLIDDLLDVTRISRGKVRLQRERLELGALLQRATEDHRESFRRAWVELELELPERPVFIDGDPTRMAQIVGNLLTNAAKFCSPGGRTEVSLDESDDNRAVIRVCDDGAGIDAQIRERLFQPFVQDDATLDRSRGGLGLGLALVKGLMEMHGGTVNVESDGPGEGAAFTLCLPLARREAERSQEAPRLAERHLEGLRVLVVEDQEDLADSLRDVLELSGHTVVTSRDGEAALEEARRFVPHVLLCDIGLPGMDGYAVARHIRREPSLQHSFLVALSGYARPQDVSDAQAAASTCTSPSRRISRTCAGSSRSCTATSSAGPRLEAAARSPPRHLLCYTSLKAPSGRPPLRGAGGAMKCKACGEDADELRSVKVHGRAKKVCEECAEQLAEQDEIAEAAEGAMQSMMEYKGRR